VPLRFERRGTHIDSVEDWFHYARPIGGPHAWRDGASAKELAKAWFNGAPAPTPPADLVALLAGHFDFIDFNFERGYPQCRVPLDEDRGLSRPVDLALVCSTTFGRVIINVIAKAREGFGRSVGDEIIASASQWAFEERRDRLDGLMRLVEIIIPKRRPAQPRLAELKNELLLSVARTWAFASQHQARVGILVLHEFLSDREESPRTHENHLDLVRLLERITEGRIRDVPIGQLIGPLPVPPSPSWSGTEQWYVGKCRTAVTQNLQLPL